MRATELRPGQVSRVRADHCRCFPQDVGNSSNAAWHHAATATAPCRLAFQRLRRVKENRPVRLTDMLMLTTPLATPLATPFATPACAETAGIETDELTLGFIKLTDMAHWRLPWKRAFSATKGWK